ncbi:MULTISPECIES: OmpH family outer membrane protein [Dethiosulfovibrio]|uniref:OmpH family outer membrane protein n=2 Tax=Dethiosulfovibrio TaxID=47054 RepID=A0ABS9ENS0_9BACT|nr:MULTISPECIES: OmpH family outer membrane protein [Dethiosulfovibrio]MCF4113066.1 OmpH family outer membrane protein [Dethiosulfovibrio russensis]MCF4141530.1 OmpH family outer membrane protein [Dethiosulfovibrio marinus]MCF4144487.1 OmpH family outer membrane protein [Dethiosulfovibrio acidaminovorans]
MGMVKSVRLVALGVLFALVFSSVAIAAEKIGVIEPQKILFQHPKFEQVTKRVQAVLDSKQNEAKSAIEKASDNKKKAEIYATKKQEAAIEEQKLMAPLFKEINLAIRTVAKAKGITVVLDKAQVFYGGVDLTEDVIQQLKKMNLSQ